MIIKRDMDKGAVWGPESGSPSLTKGVHFFYLFKHLLSEKELNQDFFKIQVNEIILPCSEEIF